jgi:hypothetical protein
VPVVVVLLPVLPVVVIPRFATAGDLEPPQAASPSVAAKVTSVRPPRRALLRASSFM